MLNKVVASELRPGQEAKVQVVLKLKHGDVDVDPGLSFGKTTRQIAEEEAKKKDSGERITEDNPDDVKDTSDQEGD